MASDVSRRAGWPDRFGRKLVQVGFLALFLYPLVPVIYQRLTYKPVPTLMSWLLPWDPLLLLGHIVHRNWGFTVIGAPLLLLAASFILGRFFCGWVCPLGTILDLIRPIAVWQKRKGARKVLPSWFTPERNSPLRYYLMVATLIGSALSLQMLGILDPLVIFHRLGTLVVSNILTLGRPVLRIYLSASVLFLGILALELWQPRFWCRNLCPLGALLGFVGRRSLLVRQVNERCNQCGACRRYCTMNAIPKDAHNTDYSDCHQCLGCESVCPQRAISFGFGDLAGKVWQPDSKVADASGKPRFKGRYVSKGERLLGLELSRRGFLGGLASGAAGLAVTPALGLMDRRTVIRPPGALPEEEFVRTCIICQECVRVCATGGLRPTFLEAGLAGIGTPQIVARQGGCSLNSSCPDLCAKACPVGAIRPIEPEQMKVGLAKVDHHLCLAWDQGVKCLVCVEACATGAAQIYSGRITVDPSRCSGCGRCENACPVVGAAIHVVPRA